MVAKIKFTEFYLASLLIALLAMGGLVQASNHDYTLRSTDWNNFLGRDKTIGACKESQWPLIIDPTCKDQHANEVIPFASQRNDLRQRLSHIGKLTKH